MTGKGLNDYHTIFRILADHHYQGWVSIEDGISGMDEMAESLAFLRPHEQASIFPGEDEAMDRIRTALVGCGKVGQIHAHGLAALPASEFVAVCDVDPARASSFAALFGVKPYINLERMLTECGVQAVCIATPHPLHAEAATVAAGTGAHVLVEKPLAASLDDCDLMLAAARTSGTKLWCDQPAALV